MSKAMYGYTNQQILDDIIAASNGADSISSKEYQVRGTIGLTTVRYHFGTWNQAVKAAGLRPIESGHSSKRRITDEELLQELVRLNGQLGKPPTEGELSAKGKYSPKPYRDRWGSVKVAFAKATELYG